MDHNVVRHGERGESLFTVARGLDCVSYLVLYVVDARNGNHSCVVLRRYLCTARKHVDVVPRLR